MKKKDLVRAFGGSSRVATICSSDHSHLSELRVCFGRDVAGFPAERIDCPQFVLDQDTCSSDTVQLRESN